MGSRYYRKSGSTPQADEDEKAELSCLSEQPEELQQGDGVSEALTKYYDEIVEETPPDQHIDLINQLGKDEN